MPKEIKNVVLIPLGVRNLNDRIYTRECLEDAVNQYQSRVGNRTAYGTINDQNSTQIEINLSKITHIIDKLWFETEDGEEIKEECVDHSDDDPFGEETWIKKMDLRSGRLMGDITLLDTSSGKMAQLLYDNSDYVFRSNSIGKVNVDGTVRIDEIISFNMLPKNEDAFDL